MVIKSTSTVHQSSDDKMAVLRFSSPYGSLIHPKHCLINHIVDLNYSSDLNCRCLLEECIDKTLQIFCVNSVMKCFLVTFNNSLQFFIVSCFCELNISKRQLPIIIKKSE